MPITTAASDHLFPTMEVLLLGKAVHGHLTHADQDLSESLSFRKEVFMDGFLCCSLEADM